MDKTTPDGSGKTVDEEKIAFRVSAPGKVILFGEHACVYGHEAIAAAIRKRATICFEKVPGGTDIVIELYNFDLTIDFKVETLAAKIQQEIPLFDKHELTLNNPKSVKFGAFRKLLEQDVKEAFPNKVFLKPQQDALCIFFYAARAMLKAAKIQDLDAFTFRIFSDLEMGAGLGSSAALCVSMAAAFYQYIQCKEGRKEIALFSLEEQGLISEWAFQFEHITHTKPSGIDTHVSSYGLFVPFNFKGPPIDRIFIPQMHILLINSGVTRSTSKMVEMVKRDKCGYMKDVYRHVFDAIGQVSVKAVKILSKEGMPCMHAHHKKISEVNSSLQSLIRVNQGLLATINVSHHALDEIVHICRKFGYSAKLTGAGGGGYAFTLVWSSASAPDLVENLENYGYSCEILPVGDVGVTVSAHLLKPRYCTSF